jgi:hypothetical protein
LNDLDDICGSDGAVTVDVNPRSLCGGHHLTRDGRHNERQVGGGDLSVAIDVAAAGLALALLRRLQQETDEKTGDERCCPHQLFHHTVLIANLDSICNRNR